MRISWDEAWDIMERTVAQGLERQAAVVVACFGVDGKAIRKGHRYVTILTDLDGLRILDVTQE